MKRIHFLLGGVLVFIAAIVFWLYQRSQESALEYQSIDTVAVEQTTSDTEVAETVLPENPSENTVADTVPDVSEKVENTVAPQKEVTVEVSDESPKEFSIKNKLVSFGHGSASGRKINTVVLHSSHGINRDPYDVEDVIALWKSYGVAPHYMIARDGTVYQLVADKNIAYHAGDSKMPDGRKNVNDFSIGVEILNTKTDKYTSAQYQATKDLIAYLKGKYGKMEVIGHDDIAPGRKTDPWNFDWDKL